MPCRFKQYEDKSEGNGITSSNRYQQTINSYIYNDKQNPAFVHIDELFEYTRYEDDLVDDGVENILKYGIACYKKRCKVMLAENR